MLAWYYLAILSGVFSSVTVVVEKHLLNKEHATSFTAVTNIATMFFTFVFLPLTNFNISLEQYAIIFAASFTFAASSLLVARLYRHGDVSTVSPITGTLPIIFIAILTLAFLNETLKNIQYVGIAVLVVAMYVMLRGTRKSISPEFLKKNAQYLVSATLLFAIGATLLKFSLSTVSAFTFLVISQIFISIMMLIFVFARFKTLKYLVRDIRSYKAEVIIFSLATTIYVAIYYYAVSLAPVSLVYPLRAGASILISVLVSGVLFKEKITKKIPIAIIMIIAMYAILA